MLQRFERGNAVEIHKGMFDFYLGLPHTYVCMWQSSIVVRASNLGLLSPTLANLFLIPHPIPQVPILSHELPFPFHSTSSHSIPWVPSVLT